MGRRSLSKGYVIPLEGLEIIMVRISVLADALKKLSNAEKRGKRQVLLRPSSKVLIKYLLVMQKAGMDIDGHTVGRFSSEICCVNVSNKPLRAFVSLL